MSFSAVHQTECTFTMVTIIAGPHYTLEGPDHFNLLPYYPLHSAIPKY